MQMLKLLIADGTEEFRMALARQLAGSYVIRSCAQGKQALEMIRSFRPDILVLDLMLPELDGISLLQMLAQENMMPTVLATTRFINDYVLDSATQFGVGYVMVKPCDVHATAARIRDLAQQFTAVPVARPDPRTMISNVLLELGFSTKLRGYTYLREAVEEAMRHPGQLVTKELYPAVAKRCDATRDQVERSVRSAIAGAYSIRNEVVWRQYFRQDCDGEIRRPSNGTVITTLAEYITRAMGETNILYTGKTSQDINKKP